MYWSYHKKRKKNVFLTCGYRWTAACNNHSRQDRIIVQGIYDENKNKEKKSTQFSSIRKKKGIGNICWNNNMRK